MFSKVHMENLKPDFTHTNCHKFNPFYKGVSEPNRSIVFVKLLKMGCPKEKALKFCSKAICKFDSTKSKDGPENFKVLKIKSCHTPASSNGWNFIYPTYDLGKNFIQNTDEIIENDDQEKLLQKHFIHNENQIREDFKKKIKNLVQYYTDLNEEYGLSKDLTEQQLNLRETQNNERKKKHYIKIRDIKCFHVGNELYKESKKDNQKNIIKELNIFPIAGNPLEKRRFSIKSDSEEEMNIPILNSNDPLITAPRTARQIIASQDPFQIANIKKRSTIFHNLEMQTKYLNDIANVESLVDRSHMSPLENKLLNKKSSLSKRSAAQLIEKEEIRHRKMAISSLDSDSKRFIEQEFNRSKYLSTKNNKKLRINSNLNDYTKKSFLLKTEINLDNIERKSYLGNAMRSEDLKDPEMFEEGLKNLARTHIEYMFMKKRNLNIDQDSLNSIKKNRDLFIKQYQSKTTKHIKSKSEHADLGFKTSRTFIRKHL